MEAGMPIFETGAQDPARAYAHSMCSSDQIDACGRQINDYLGKMLVYSKEFSDGGRTLGSGADNDVRTRRPPIVRHGVSATCSPRWNTADLERWNHQYFALFWRRYTRCRLGRNRPGYPERHCRVC